MALDSNDAILIGIIVTIVIIGLAGGITLVVFICMKWADHRKRLALAQPLPSRQRSRRRRIRVRHSSETIHIEEPPPYIETETDPPPPYSVVGTPATNSRRDGNTRGSQTGGLSPLPRHILSHSGRRRTSVFGSHLNTGTTNSPLATPASSMFRSSIFGTREHSASSNIRSVHMVHFESSANRIDAHSDVSYEVNTCHPITNISEVG
ncbi:uncharacterized protein LOC127859582 [Dreissena polymorpha]|uniref:Uncharacterized protein n=1 Tax=Dreissena polymorpha TaxID=45954 RepID=A0A9D3YJA5_DREPO|nr:uncharacterized protein LOC127859582 [Dreissena polymorpha]KAH3699506.1 hypothetical protein DPMN_074462 [Dreissena polymorpha]